MKKNIIIISLIFAIPLLLYMALTASNSTTAQTTDIGKPSVIKFTSAMCLNKIFKEIFPKYQNKINFTEIQVQDKNSFNDSQIKKYNVTLVPTIILLNSEGKQVKRIEGAIPKEEMDKYLQGLE